MRMWHTLGFGLVLVISVSYGQAPQPESNGAVPGLLPPAMEFQFASRMEGKTLFQIGEDVIRQGPAFLNTDEFIPQGVAKGMKVKGQKGKYASWEIVGLERELGPIRLHVHRIAAEFKEAEKLNADQTRELEKWLKRFDDADKKCGKEPTIANLDTLSDVLLLDVAEVFAPIERKEIKLLEAVMMSSAIDKRLYQIESYFSQVLQLYRDVTDKTKTEEQRDEAAEKIESVSLTIDGVGVHPSAVLFKGPGKEVTGFDEKYGAWIKRIRESLEAGGEETFAEKLKTLETQIKDGKLSRIGETRELLNAVYERIFKDKTLAPVGLRIGVGLYASNQFNLFGRLRAAIQNDPKSKEYKIGGITIRLEGDPKVLKLTIVDSEKTIEKQLDQLLQLTEQTKAQARLGKADLDTIEKAVQGLKESKASLGKPIRYSQWAEWSNAVNDLHLLYKF